MFRARPIAIALVTFFVVSLVWQAIALWLPPAPSRPGTTSWSASPGGARALYTLLESLELPVARSTQPPVQLFTGQRRVVLYAPDMRLIEQEKGALVDMERWLRDGGELVVIASEIEADWEEIETMFTGNMDEMPAPYEVLTRDDFKKHIGAKDTVIQGLPFEAVQEEDAWDVYGALKQVNRRIARPDEQYEIAGAEGTLAAVAEGVEEIYLAGPRAGRIEIDEELSPLGTLRVVQGDDEPVLLAAEYALGEGRVLLVAEPILFSNVGLSAGDNAVIAARLLAGDGSRPIVIDEFYHGGMPVGEPLVLFGMYPYGVILVTLLLMAALWAWRQSVAFGPPLADAPPPRRSIVEYIDAMGQLFQRAGKRRFALETCRRGILEDLRHELHLPHGAGETSILKRLDSHDPARAAALRDALTHVDQALAADDPPRPRELVQLQERLEACRLPSRNPEAETTAEMSSANSTGAA